MKRTHGPFGLLLGAAALCSAWAALSHCSSPVSSTPTVDAESGGAGGSDAGGASGAGGAGARSDDGDTCRAALRLVMPNTGASSTLSVAGSTRGAGDTRHGGLAACAGFGDGADRYYRLDLTEFRERVVVRALLDAEFDAVLSLEQGPCEDLTERLCDRGRAAGRASSALTAELDPGEYLLVVDGAGPDDAGDFRLQLAAEPLDSACETPLNTSCDAATPLSFDLPVQTVFVPARCDASDDAESNALFYSLDLSEEKTTVGVVVSLTRAQDFVQSIDTVVAPEILASADGDACGEAVAPGSFWNADGLRVNTSLAPGKYRLRLDEEPELPSWMIVEIVRPDCSGNIGDSCDSPVDLDVSDGFVQVSSNTYCNTNTLDHEDCSDEPAPERFFRLDLSGRMERARVRARLPPRDLDFYAELIFLERQSDGDCGSALQCYDYIGDAEGWPSIDVIVDPGVYLIAVEGVTENAVGSFALEVEVSDFRTRSYQPCVSFDVDSCLFYYNYASSDCCFNPLSPECATGLISCGLDPAVQDCVCESDPVCCDGDEEDFERCAAVFADCGYFCAGEPASLFACIDQEELRAPAGG